MINALLLGNRLIDQPVHGFDQGVVAILGHTVGRKFLLRFCNTCQFLPLHALFGFQNHARRIAHRGGPCRHWFCHHRIRTNLGAFAHGERTQHLRTSTHHHALLKGWMAFAFGKRRSTQSDPLINGHVVMNFCSFADDHAHAVIYEYTPADGGARVNFNAGEKTPQLGQKTCQCS